MAVIKENGDEWVVEPTPIVVPADDPSAVPTSAPVEPVEAPVG